MVSAPTERGGELTKHPSRRALTAGPMHALLLRAGWLDGSAVAVAARMGGAAGRAWWWPAGLWQGSVTVRVFSVPLEFARPYHEASRHGVVRRVLKLRDK